MRVREGQQGFFDMLSLSIKESAMRSAKISVCVGAAGAVVTGMRFSAGNLQGIGFYILLSILMFISAIKEFILARSMTADSYNKNERSSLMIYGADESERKVVSRLDEDYKAGRLIFSKNRNHFKFFLFPDYLVCSDGARISIVAVKKVYWAYYIVKQGIKHRSYTFMLHTADEKISFKLVPKADAKLLMEQLAANYGVWLEYDERLKMLFETDRAKFCKEMEEYRQFGKEPIRVR